jgi:DNA-binding beta-propeller fold protein YncE
MLAGCRHAVPIDIVWPPPPDSPRIRYLRAIRASSDVEGLHKRNLLIDILLGGQQKVFVVKKPYGVIKDRFGRVLVADTGWGKVLVFDFPKKKFWFLGDDPAGTLSKPACIAEDKDGTLYVSDIVLHRVYVYDKDGKFERALAKKGRFAQPVGVAVDPVRHHVYVVDMRKHQFSIFDTNGREIKTIGKRGGGKAEFNYPSNVAVAPNGDVYVVDTFNFRVQRFDSDGNFLNMWGGRPGDLPGMFMRPKGVAVDPDGDVYVVDSAFHNVQVFTPKGRLLLFFGSIGTALGHFYLPAGIFITPDGDIYVTSQLNRRVDVLHYLGGPQVSPAPGGPKGPSASPTSPEQH